jgi:uncharacterized membrane protein
MKLPKEPESKAVAIVLVIAALAVSAYIIACIYFGWGVSGNPTNWGPFGDYFGGVLNPAIALAALYVLVIATKFQKIEFAATRSHFEKESNKNEIYRLITNIERKIESKLEVEVKNDRGQNVITFGPLNQYLKPGWKPPPKTFISLGNSNLCTEIKPYSQQILELVEMLDELTKQYDEIDGGKHSVVSKHLIKLYGPLKLACEEQIKK